VRTLTVTQAQQPGGFLGKLITRHAELPPEEVEQLVDRLAEDAAGAMAALTEQVRHAFEQASDMHDAVHRLSLLKLDPTEFAEAMTRGLALANLVGQASLIDTIKGGK
jgi:DNA-binding helix-hairpin-helix protein with protein kinase domain